MHLNVRNKLRREIDVSQSPGNPYCGILHVILNGTAILMSGLAENSLGEYDAYAKVNTVRPTILLVEDDETDIMFMQRFLKKSDFSFELKVARDGNEALQMLEEPGVVRRPYVVVTDLNMPGMSGHDLIKNIRANESTRNSVVFVLSSSRLAGDINKAYSQNIAGYISKKQDSEELSNSLRSMCEFCDSILLPC